MPESGSAGEWNRAGGKELSTLDSGVLVGTENREMDM